jgi:hypothetical protein
MYKETVEEHTRRKMHVSAGLWKNGGHFASYPSFSYLSITNYRNVAWLLKIDG